MSMIGASPDELRKAAHSFDAAATRLHDLRAALAARLHVVHWHGHEADAFRGDWRAAHAPRLHAAEEMLHEGAGRLRHNALQQEIASGARGGGGLGGGGDMWQSPTELFERWLSIAGIPLGIVGIPDTVASLVRVLERWRTWKGGPKGGVIHWKSLKNDLFSTKYGTRSPVKLPPSVEAAKALKLVGTVGKGAGLVGVGVGAAETTIAISDHRYTDATAKALETAGTAMTFAPGAGWAVGTALWGAGELIEHRRGVEHVVSAGWSFAQHEITAHPNIAPRLMAMTPIGSSLIVAQQAASGVHALGRLFR